MPQTPRRGPAVVFLNRNIGDTMCLRNDKNLELQMVTSFVLSLHLLDLVHAEKNATFIMTWMQGSKVREVFVLIFLTKANVKGVQIATLSTAFRMKLKATLGRGNLEMLEPRGPNPHIYVVIISKVFSTLGSSSP